MKTTIKKIKNSLTILWLLIISFPSKVLGQLASQVISNDLSHMQTKYGVQSIDISTFSPEPASTIINITKLIQVLLIVIVFIVGIVNFIKIRKIHDKDLREKKTKKIIVFMVITLISAFLLSLGIRLIKKHAI